VPYFRRLEHDFRAAVEGDFRDAALQYVRKISGYRTPSNANRAVFEAAVDDIAAVTDRLLKGLVVASGSKPASPVQRRLRA
jgi:hypothetical protein